jgi:hypothetical protein
VFGYKARFEPSNEQTKDSQESFVNRDRSVGDYDTRLLQEEIARRPHLWRSARSIIARIIGAIDWTNIIPSHGPGSVFPKHDPAVRSNFSLAYENIEKYYPFHDYFVCLPGFFPYGIQRDVDWTVSSAPIRSKLVCVPKDSRGPRLISVHPRESIWIQQGQRKLLEDQITRQLYPFISLKDQSINGDLALSSSLDRKYCTIDMKEASDCLSCGVVRYLFGDYAYDRISFSRAEEIQLLDDVSLG